MGNKYNIQVQTGKVYKVSVVRGRKLSVKVFQRGIGKVYTDGDTILGTGITESDPLHVNPNVVADVEKKDVFYATNGQTDFTLSETPSGIVKFFINGIQVYSFNVSGNVVTYTGVSYSLTTTDFIEFLYF